MNKTLKSIIAGFVALAFIGTIVLCSCLIKEALVKKAACSHCASKGAPASHGCCFSKAMPMEIAKAGLLTFLPLVVFAVFTLLYITPRPRLALRSVYINGPPGYVSRVPLYIQSRNIRI